MILSLSTIKKEIENKKKFIFDLERTNPKVNNNVYVFLNNLLRPNMKTIPIRKIHFNHPIHKKQ